VCPTWHLAHLPPGMGASPPRHPPRARGHPNSHPNSLAPRQTELLAIPLESELPPVNPLRHIHTLEYLESLLTVRGVLKPEGITYKGP